MIERLLDQLQTIEAITLANVEGVDDAASRRARVADGNSIYWNVGHLLSAYDGTLELLGRPRIVDAEFLVPFRRGSSPDQEPETPFEELVAKFREASRGVIEGVRELPPERYDEKTEAGPRNNPDETVLSLLFLIAFHQSYHCGQIGTLRHAGGLPGAIA